MRYLVHSLLFVLAVGCMPFESVDDYPLDVPDQLADQGCIPKKSKVCADEGIYWADSCGLMGDLVKRCGPMERCMLEEGGPRCVGPSCIPSWCCEGNLRLLIDPCTLESLLSEVSEGGCFDVPCRVSGWCAEPEVDCGSGCVDLGSDPQHCGTCHRSCDGTCVAGVCLPPLPCSPDKQKCGNACLDLLNDPMNCGSCANVCPADETCEEGVCVCQPLSRCNGNVIETSGCGYIGYVECGEGEACFEDAELGPLCRPKCPEGFVHIEAGSVGLGSAASEQGRDVDEPERVVSFSRSFCISAHEVTQSEYELVMKTNPSLHLTCYPDCPVEQVTWHEAAAYALALNVDGDVRSCYECTVDTQSQTACTALQPKECWGYRLPTEAEWEYAARAGSEGATYAGEVSGKPYCFAETGLDAIAWYCSNSSGELKPVGGMSPNGWGLFDMLGGVREWCHDPYVFAPQEGADPFPQDAEGNSRAVRGGGFKSFGRDCRAASREGVLSNSAFEDLGFRLVYSIPQE